MGEKGNPLEAVGADPMAMLADVPVQALRETPEIFNQWAQAYLAMREIQSQRATVAAEKATLAAEKAQTAAEAAAEAAKGMPAEDAAGSSGSSQQA